MRPRDREKTLGKDKLQAAETQAVMKKDLLP